MASRLREEFISFMTVRRLAPKTQQAYLNAVAGLAKFHNCAPDKLINHEIQAYLEHIIKERQLAWSSVNVAFCGYKCFFMKFLKWKENQITIPPRPRKRQLPEVLTQDEVHRLIYSLENIKHRAILMIIYGGGLRVSEAVCLKPCHIESNRMMIRVENAKGRKDRYTLLSRTALETLRLYWKASNPKPKIWLFPGQDHDKHISIESAQRIYHKGKKRADIKKGQGIHMLRHGFATHLLEQGEDIFVIKQLSGHRAIETTSRYLHVTQAGLGKVKSPLDFA